MTQAEQATQKIGNRLMTKQAKIKLLDKLSSQKLIKGKSIVWIFTDRSKVTL